MYDPCITMTSCQSQLVMARRLTPRPLSTFFHSGLQDAALWQLSRGCRWLKELKVSWCVQLTDVSFGQVAKMDI